MKIRTLNILLILGIILIMSCNEDDGGENSITSDSTTLISSEAFLNAPSDQLTINSLEITENCLNINFSASGCSGDTWELQLIDSDEILESIPLQRNLRLSLKNEEECEAFITQELSFDISNVQVNGNQVILNILNSGDKILYEY